MSVVTSEKKKRKASAGAAASGGFEKTVFGWRRKTVAPAIVVVWVLAAARVVRWAYRRIWPAAIVPAAARGK